MEASVHDFTTCIDLQVLLKLRRKKRISSKAPLEPIPASEQMAGNFSFTYGMLP
ncbi:hypothetical protein POF51_25010 [Brevibacillus sp. AG]|uniref:hypothetical protein n=1 Tax=Brevibacillus sp. AG TaxID=3020891 RepID=UPI00232E6F51|nr:hypothetical protein [Brevibacillus sp. AG]MDC0763979.1 hypothetical protein [Brevibacillus sp. AG]